MGKIHHLSPDIIAKIAAGEVIERPAFAVKELIENALDAQATTIAISVENAGLRKIQIIDNGEGMDKIDLEACWKPHTTSKLAEKDSLIGIKSFGFRGEALASLAAVSTLTIKSRTKDEKVGNQIVIKEGKKVHSIPTGMPEGTTIIAENLFSQIPARKKFLKSNQTELRHIVDVFNHFAIAYPHIHFSLYHNNRLLLEFHANETIQKRIQAIVGQQNFSLFLPVKNIDSYISITGFVAKPQINLSSQSKQILFVNKRKVTDKLISLAVKEAFGTMLEATTYPLFVLFLDFPYEMVDVNVHPRKEQVVFLNNRIIFQKVKETITQVLQENNITFQNLSWKRRGVGTTHSFAGKLLKKKVLEKELQTKPNSCPIQINNLYILNETKSGIIFTDQHAAHERILFEKLSKEFINQKRKHQSFQLKNPIVLHLSLSEKIIFEEHRILFKKLGFVITQTENNAAVITHTPFLFQDRDPEALIKQFLENVEEEIPLKQMDKISEEMIAFLACRAAVKAGDTLDEEKMRNILLELENTPNKATCPHGRPTSIFTSFDQLDNFFKR